MSLRIGVLGASRIAELAIVGPAQELGHRLVAVAARDPRAGQGLRRKARCGTGSDVVRRGDRRSRGRRRLQPAGELVSCAVESGCRRRGQARADREAVRPQSRRGATGCRGRRCRGNHRDGGLPLPVSSGDASRARAGRRRHAGRPGPCRGADGHARTGGRRPEVVTRAGRWRADGPRLLRPARHATAGPAVGDPGARRAAQPGRRRLVRRRSRVPRRSDRPEHQLDGGRRLHVHAAHRRHHAEMCWCTTSSSHTTTTG